MVTFLALYRGDTIGDARLVATCADPTLVAEVAARMLGTPAPEDPVLAAVDQGRRRALRLIKQEASRQDA